MEIIIFNSLNSVYGKEMLRILTVWIPSASESNVQIADAIGLTDELRGIPTSVKIST